MGTQSVAGLAAFGADLALTGIDRTTQQEVHQRECLGRMDTPEGVPHPYIEYTLEHVYAFRSRYELTRDPGDSHEYSNLGMGLLGHALANRAGTSFEALLMERPLPPRSTRRLRPLLEFLPFGNKLLGSRGR